MAAMERIPSQVAFVSGPEELRDILAHRFAVWRIFLHPTQRRMALEMTYSGPVSGDRRHANQDLLQERCVLFVACTRARDHLYVSYSGQPSPFLPG